MDSINQRVVLSYLFIAILALAAFVCKDHLMSMVRFVLEHGFCKIAVNFFVIVTILTHSIFVKDTDVSGIYFFKSGLKPLDVFLTTGTYIAVSSTATSLAEGAFIQSFFGDVNYFKEFSAIDIYTLLGVSALLLWYVIFHMIILMKEALFNKDAVESDSQKHNKLFQRPLQNRSQ